MIRRLHNGSPVGRTLRAVLESHGWRKDHNGYSRGFTVGQTMAANEAAAQAATSVLARAGLHVRVETRID